MATPLCSRRTFTVLLVNRFVNSLSGTLFIFSPLPLTKFSKFSVPIKSIHADSIATATLSRRLCANISIPNLLSSRSALIFLFLGLEPSSRFFKCAKNDQISLYQHISVSVYCRHLFHNKHIHKTLSHLENLFFHFHLKEIVTFLIYQYSKYKIC